MDTDFDDLKTLKIQSFTRQFFFTILELLNCEQVLKLDVSVSSFLSKKNFLNKLLQDKDKKYLEANLNLAEKINEIRDNVDIYLIVISKHIDNVLRFLSNKNNKTGKKVASQGLEPIWKEKDTNKLHLSFRINSMMSDIILKKVLTFDRYWYKRNYLLIYRWNEFDFLAQETYDPNLN